MAEVTELSDSTFQSEVLESAEPVLVDFWAPTCLPCRQIAPLVEELAAENAGSLKVVKLNVHENPNVAMQFQVMSIPTLMIFKNGEVVERFVGLQPKPRLQEAVDQAMQA